MKKIVVFCKCSRRVVCRPMTQNMSNSPLLLCGPFTILYKEFSVRMLLYIHTKSIYNIIVDERVQEFHTDFGQVLYCTPRIVMCLSHHIVHRFSRREIRINHPFIPFNSTMACKTILIQYFWTMNWKNKRRGGSLRLKKLALFRVTLYNLTRELPIPLSHQSLKNNYNIMYQLLEIIYK